MRPLWLRSQSMAALLRRSLNRRCYDLQPCHGGTFNQAHDSVPRPPPPPPLPPVSVSKEAEPTRDSQATEASVPHEGGESLCRWIHCGTEVKEME